MIFSPNIFYSTYLTDYHKLKITTIKKILDNQDKYQKDFFEEDPTLEEKQAYRKTLLADLRQTYFHAMESFFELFFALNPLDKNFTGDQNILIALTHARWRESYEKIEQIANDPNALDFLDERIQKNGVDVSVGHYIFYYNLLAQQKKIPDFEEQLISSLEAIKYGIRLIAQDFIDRDEYNAYKHGLRIIPALKELSVVNLATGEKQLSWNLEDAMSFFTKSKEFQTRIVTKIFDPERDYRMTYFCSNLITNIITYRKIAFDLKKGTTSTIPIYFFGKEEIDKCQQINVEIQNLIYPVKRVEA